MFGILLNLNPFSVAAAAATAAAAVKTGEVYSSELINHLCAYKPTISVVL